MNIPIWIKSAYVTYIGNTLLSISGGFSPSEKEGKPPGSMISLFSILSHDAIRSKNYFLRGYMSLFKPSFASTLPSCSPDIRHPKAES